MLSWSDIGIGLVAVLQVFQFVMQRIFEARLKADIEWEQKKRAQAARVAEYLAGHAGLKDTSDPGSYERMNRLGFELAMWLPPDLYRAMATAATSPNAAGYLDVVIAARQLLLGGKAGDLTREEVLFHQAGIGRRSA